MVIEIQINKAGRKTIAALATLSLCALLAALAVRGAVVGLLTDDRTRVAKPLLSSGAKYAPNSAPLRARLAAAEMALRKTATYRSLRTMPGSQ